MSEMDGRYIWLLGGAALGVGAVYLWHRNAPAAESLPAHAGDTTGVAGPSSPTSTGGSPSTASPTTAAGTTSPANTGSPESALGKTGGFVTTPPPRPDISIAVAPTAQSVTMHLQRALTAMGFYTGPVSGEMSADMADAIRRYQASKGLETTGQIDDALIASMGWR